MRRHLRPIALIVLLGLPSAAQGDRLTGVFGGPPAPGLLGDVAYTAAAGSGSTPGDAGARLDSVIGLPPAPPLDLSRELPPPGASYVAEEVRVRSFESHSLAGTLTLPWRPAGSGPRRVRFPAVVLITGEGRHDRDQTPAENLGRPPGEAVYRPFYEIADTLTRRGIAVLRLDDRGVGASTGSLDSADTFDRSYDIRAALEYLRHRTEINAKRIGLVGLGEGATIAAIVARLDPGIRAIALLAGPSETGRISVERQRRRAIAEDATIPPGQRDSVLAAQMAEWNVRAAMDRRMRFYATYDPLESARAVAAPVLILQGSADEVEPPESAGRLAAAFRSAGNRDVTVQVLDGLTHDLLPAAPRGSEPSARQTLRLPPKVLGVIADWLPKRLGGPSARAAERGGSAKRSAKDGSRGPRRHARRGAIVPGR